LVSLASRKPRTQTRHKVATHSRGIAGMASLIAWLLGSIVAVLLIGVGRGILQLLGIGKLYPAATVAVSLGLGAVLFSQLFLLMGLAGWIDSHLYWTILVVGAFCAWPGLYRLVGELWTSHEPKDTLEPGWLRVALKLALAVALAMAFVSAGAPVSDSDSRGYHVGGPQRYIREGSIQFYTDDVQLTFYQGQSMLNLWLMVLGSDSAAQVLSWWFAVSLVLSVYSLAKRAYGQGTGIVAAVIVGTFPLVAERGIQPSPDMASTMMSLVLVYLGLESGRRAYVGVGWAVAIGVLAGGAVIFRLNAALFLVAAGLLVPVWWRWMCRVRWTQVVLLCVIGCTAFIAMILPWALRNYTWTGNPVYPFFSAWFGGWVLPEDASQYLMAQLRVGSSFSLVKIGTRLTDLLTDMRFNVLVFALPWFAPLFGADRRTSVVFIATWLTSLVVSLNLADAARFYAPTMAFAAMLAGHVLVRLLRWGGVFRWALGGLVLLITCINVGAAAIWYLQFARVALGDTDRDTFLAASSAFYNDFLWMNEHLPADAKVLAITRETYYLERPALRFIPVLTPQSGLFDFNSYADAEEFLVALHLTGVTHFFFPDPMNMSEFSNWTLRNMGERGFQLFTEIYTHHATLVRHNPDSMISGRFFKGERVATWLYRLNPPPKHITDVPN
jgi:hypothetical protein